MPNLQGASPTSRGGGSRSYAAGTVSRGRQNLATSWSNEILGAAAIGKNE